MDFIKTDIVSLVYYLLPGFLSAWIYYSFTAHPRPAPFERVVQALIFTTIIQACVFSSRAIAFLIGRVVSFGTWSDDSSFVAAVCFAVVVGFVVSALANTGKFHADLPDWLSKRTSFPTEWFSAFNRTKSYVYLHLNDQRRIYGWPEEWPDQPGTGHFILMNAAWILDNNEPAPLTVTERILIPAAKVVFVEFEVEDPEDSEEHRESERKLIDAQDQTEDDAQDQTENDADEEDETQ